MSSLASTPVGPPLLPEQPRRGAGRGARRGESAPRQRLYVLDGLRLVAALCVMLWHYTGIQRFPEIWDGRAADHVPALHRFGVYGWAGVELFFVISGFVICMSCWGRSVGEFVTSRVTRLIPAYWFGVLLTSTLLFATRPPWAKDILKLSFSNALTNLTMMQEPLNGLDVEGVYWTLWIELRFYLLFGLLAIGGLTYRKVVVFCGAWTVLSVITSATGLTALSVVTFPTYSPYFIAGIALYMIHRFGPNVVLWATVGVSWLLAQNQLNQVLRDYSTGATEQLSFPVAFALVTVVFLLMSAVALGLFDWMRWRWLTVAGSLTFPLYLVHEELGWWAIHRWHRQTGGYSLVALLTCAMLILAWLVHRFVERPGAALLKRWMASAMADIRRADR